MTWLFSKALMGSVSLPCSQGLEAESSEATYSDGEPSAQWNVMPTPQGFWRNDKMMDASRLSQFGPTLRLLRAGHGEAVLMSFLEGFPARISPQPVEAQDLPERDQDSGLSSLESLAKYDLDTCSWKTPQYSLLGGLVPFSETWPRWGTMQNGVCWVRPMLARHTKETGSGLRPAPNVPNGGRSVARVTEWSESGRTAYHKGKKVQVGLESAVRLWPTPLANSHTGAGHGPNKKGGMNLQTAVKKWPTPQASDNRDRGNLSSPAIKRRREKGKQIMLSQSVSEENGRLNPQWVEMLMGWPKDWTSLEPMNHIEYKKWLMGFTCYAKCENSRSQIVRSLWEDFGKEAFQRASRGLSDIPEAETLLTEMRKHPDGIDAAWIQLASQETPEERLRSVRLQREIASASRGSGYNEQHGSEYTDALQTLSRLLAHYGQACWEDGSWENATPRVVDGLAYRVDRLKAIGNGQVPLVEATSFNQLRERLT